MTSPAPKVSVVCAWYDRADYIRDTVDSLLAQDYANFDITVVNDGSPDPRVREILDSYKDPRLIVVHQDNTGFTCAIRRAIEESDGEYIAIQGAGDVSLPGRLSAQVAYLEESGNAAACATIYELIDTYSRKRIMTAGAPATLTRQDLRTSMPITQGTFVYRREAYNSAGGYNPLMKYAQDLELLLAIAEKGVIGVVQEVHYQRYVFDDGATYNPRKRIEQKHYGIIAQKNQRRIEKSDLELLSKPDFVFLPRNIPATIAIIGGSVKRGTYRVLPESFQILSRQIINLFRERLS